MNFLSKNVVMRFRLIIVHGAVNPWAEPGSAGCIDLTHHIDEFTQWFEKNGHDLIINVKYY